MQRKCPPVAPPAVNTLKENEMPRSNNIAAYPEQLFAVAHAVRDTRRPVEIELSTEKEVEYLRMQWYGFLNAYTKQSGDESIRAVMCARLAPARTGESWRLRFSHRDTPPTMQALGRALAAALQSTPQDTRPPEGPPASPPAAQPPVYHHPRLPESPLARAEASEEFEAAIDAWLGADGANEKSS